MKFSNLLLVAVDTENFTVADSLLVALIGILVVFAVLCIIIFLLWAQSKIFKTLDNKKTKAPTAPVAVAVKEPTSTVTQNSNDELIAVISACVYAMLEEDETVDSDAEFVIRKIEKIKRSN